MIRRSEASAKIGLATPMPDGRALLLLRSQWLPAVVERNHPQQPHDFPRDCLRLLIAHQRTGRSGASLSTGCRGGIHDARKEQALASLSEVGHAKRREYVDGSRKPVLDWRGAAGKRFDRIQ